MLVNALLVRWQNGWREVIDAASITAHGRREALLTLGAQSTVAEVDRVAIGQLVIFADPRTEIGVDLAAVDDTDRPYLAFGVGDRVVSPDLDGTPLIERVVGMTAARDDEGQMTFAPDLRDVILDAREREQQNLDKMASGSMGGASKVAAPVAPTPKGDTWSVVPTTGGG